MCLIDTCNLFENVKNAVFTFHCYEKDQSKAVSLEKCWSLLQILFDFTRLI